MSTTFCFSLLLLALLNYVYTITVAPTWVTSSYIRASSNLIINGTTKIGSSSASPTATMIFSSAFSAAPNLAYGVCHYESSDNLGEEMYEVNRTGLTATSFSVLVKISGNTDLWLMRVRYVGVDKQFPHHLNSFDNVPCNYNNGSLTFFSSKSATARTYTNNINYTLQAQSISSAYTTFSTPLSNNKILLFMTSMYLDGDGGEPSSFYAIDLQVSATPISSSMYTITVTLGVQVIVTRLHYSMIIFDQYDVQFTGYYFLVCDRINFSTSGGSVGVPVEFEPNSIMAFTDFYSYRTQACITFFLNYQTLTNGSYGINMPPSQPRDTSRNKITRFGFTLFYLKSWTCPAGYFLDLSTNLCTDCSISLCTTCLNSTYCKVCLVGYQTNTGTGQCDPVPCNLTNCLTCVTIVQCAICDTNNSYYLSNGSCLFCNNSLNRFINPTNLTCDTCSLTSCIICASLTQCSVCNNSNAYFLSSMNSLCYPCNVSNCATCQNLTICQTCSPGYVINNALGSCEVCTLTGCSICNDSTTCTVCNSLSNYILETNGSCTLCQTASNYFANSTSNTCQICSVPQCLSCTSLTTCQTCNISNSYYLNNSICIYCNGTSNQFINITDGMCYTCNLANCLTCQSLSRCTLCGPGYLVNNISGLCQVCTIAGCINCSTLTECVVCDTASNYIHLANNTCQLCLNASNYFANGVTNQCQLCNLTQCLVCSSLIACQTCNLTNSYYSLNGTCTYCDPSANTFINITDGLCYLCSPTNCLTCESATRCTTCVIGFLVNPVSGLCQVCTLLGCLNCSTLSTCAICDTSSNYILLANFTCEFCQPGYFANGATEQCQLCNVSQCMLCSSLINCQTCNNFYVLENNTCTYCDPSLNFFINATLKCELCNIVGCITCSSLTQCLLCNATASYFPNTTDNLCYPCSIPNCIQCQTLTTCSICNQSSQHFLNSSGLCQPCSLTGCLNCSSLTTCRQCDLNNSYGFAYTSVNMSQCGHCNVNCICGGYGLPWNSGSQTCTSICGDGNVVLNQQCDDNNTINGDGCSIECIIELYYSCTGSPSNCTSNFVATPKFLSIQKSGCNGFVIKINKVGLSFSQISSGVSILNKGITIQKMQQEGDNISIFAEYTKDIINESINLFVLGEVLNIQYNPILPPLHYSDTQCTSVQNTAKFVLGNQIAGYSVMFLSLLSCKIVGLELFGVLQISYFTLASHSFLNLYLSPLVSLKMTNGLNIQFIPQNNEKLPKSIKEMGVSTSFINNVNIMILTMIGHLFMTFVLYLVARVTSNEKLRYFTLNFLKQGFVTLILFNSFNIAFSAGVHFKYSDSTSPHYMLSCGAMALALLGMVAAVFAMQLTEKNTYGEFKKKFKENFLCELFIPFTVLYRMSLGFYIALKNETPESTLIILAFSLVFMMYMITNLPYRDAYQNYRSCITHISIICILFTANYYRQMKDTTPMQIKARIYTPAIIQLVLMAVCIGVSAIVACYEVYLVIKECNKNKQIKNDSKSLQNQHQITDYSDVDFT